MIKNLLQRKNILQLKDLLIYEIIGTFDKLNQKKRVNFVIIYLIF